MCKNFLVDFVSIQKIALNHIFKHFAYFFKTFISTHYDIIQLSFRTDFQKEQICVARLCLCTSLTRVKDNIPI